LRAPIGRQRALPALGATNARELLTDEPSCHCIDVLLRHRPRSISLARRPTQSPRAPAQRLAPQKTSFSKLLASSAPWALSVPLGLAGALAAGPALKPRYSYTGGNERASPAATSALSCDIAYSESPAASRAACSSRNRRMREILPSWMRTVSKILPSSGSPPRGASRCTWSRTNTSSPAGSRRST
jgi:hypothetical protein